jgi:hypothetical protein
MAVTENLYTGNGSTVLYSFTFPYLETTDIKVSVNGTITTAYTLANATTIQFNTAPANGAAIRIYRQTDDAALAATFYSGSAIRASDLNENFTQNLYVTQESNRDATQAITTANSATTTANTALSNSTAAVSTANTASANATAAVNTANTASANASTAVSTANTASSNATAAVNTANTASANATTALNTANATAASQATLAANVYDSTELDSGQLDNRYYTETELNAGQLDNRYYTETELNAGILDSQYFRQDNSETINSGMAWSSSDGFIATTKAIDARIIDLVDDVGGFVPIVNENSFPATNPDVNSPDGSGTIISVKEIVTTRTPVAGTVTIANGSSGNTVTITGCGTTILAAGFGILVETTSTLHTYTFHRLVPKATEVSTVAGISPDVTTVAGNTANINAVAANQTNINAVAGNNSNITAVAGNSANINSVSSNNANVTTVAGSVGNVNTVGNAITNVNAVATSIAHVNNVSNNIGSVNSVASNLGTVNDFANRYRVASVDPTTSLDVGDLAFITSQNAMKIYNGTSWQLGVTAVGNLVAKSGDLMTGPLGFVAGNAVSPSLYVSGDTDTGIYSSGANVLDVTTGGTAKVRFDNTTAPLKEIYSSAYYPVVTSVDIGSAPDQVSLNYMLGNLAFMDDIDRLRASATAPTNSLDINFEYVSDTSIKVRMRGSDGTVRSATLTLS